MEAQESKCPLCDGQVTFIGDPSRKTAEYTCEGSCGTYTFNDEFLREMQNSQHWERTRKDLARALALGVVRERDFNCEVDIRQAMISLSRTEKS